MYFRDAGQTEWQVFNPTAATEVEPNVYGFMNGMNNDKTVLDLFFWKIRCDGDAGASANVILEQNQIPLTLDWETLWARDFLFNWDRKYEWTESIGARQFLLEFQFTR